MLVGNCLNDVTSIMEYYAAIKKRMRVVYILTWKYF